MRAAVDQRVRDSGRRFRVIPVLLPGGKRDERSSLPTFLAATMWVEFRDSLEDPDAFYRLVCGIRRIERGRASGHVPSSLSLQLLQKYCGAEFTLDSHGYRTSASLSLKKSSAKRLHT